MATRSRATAAGRIVRDPRILDGEPIVAGTRVPVRSVVLAYRLYADTERIVRAFPTLDSAAVEAALAFYAAQPEEIDRAIAENEDATEA